MGTPTPHPPYPPVGTTMNNPFTHFQLGASSLENINTIYKEEPLFETNMELCNLRFEKIEISEEVTEPVVKKS